MSAIVSRDARVKPEHDGGGFDAEAYLAFLRAKSVIAPRRGIEIADSEINLLLLAQKRTTVRWALARGCAGLFDLLEAAE